MSDQTILDDAKDRYKIAVDGWSHIYDDATDDMRFTYDIDGGQWPESIRAEREKDNRPVITVNKIQKFVRQIRGEQQQNRPRVKVIPVDNKADVQKAELYNGLIRQIEYLSDAGIAYDTAYGHAIASSIGFWRLVTKFSDDNPFEQDLFIKRVLNPMSVHFDPEAKEFELEDAKYCFIEELVDKDEFKRKYPQAEKIDFSSSQKELFGDWLFNDQVRVAEYFWKDSIEKKFVLLDSGAAVELSEDLTPELIQAKGFRIVKDKTVNTHKIMWCKMNGVEILEQSEWAGKYIPVIPVFGDEIVIEGKKYYLSLIRGAKDPAKMYNYWATAATETVALAPKQPYVVDHRQVKGYENEWEESNRKNRMFIRYNAIAGLPKPERERQTEIPAAIMAMMQTTAFDIEDHLGRYESSKGQTSNERSGKAITARIKQSDKGTYTFIDNLTRAIVYTGRQIVDLIPKIYDTQRALRVMGETGEQQVVNVNIPSVDESGQVGLVNDLSVGKYDVIATVGASFGSKRQEMVEMMAQSMQYAPNLAPFIAPLIFKYSDWPGAEEVAGAIQQAVAQQQQAQQQKP